MIPIKNSEEIEIMKEGGKIAINALRQALTVTKPGVSLHEIDLVVQKVIDQAGAKASFKSVRDYYFATCINLNSGIVHGIPDKKVIKRGDVVSIDLGVLFKGFHTDLSYSLEIGTHAYDKFLLSGKIALKNAVFNCIEGNRIGDISNAIQAKIERSGYTVSQSLVGHGVGKDLHERPYVPGYGVKGMGLKLKAGMVFAVEVIYQIGKPDIILDKDGWTLRTKDGSISALFEETVLIGKEKPVILTDFDAVI